MTCKEDNPQSPTGSDKKMSAKEQRDERLKKSLRANLQRRKAKMRAVKAADQDSSAD